MSIEEVYRFRTGEAALRVGCKNWFLLKCEKEGLIDPPKRDKSDQRRWNQRSIEQAKKVFFQD